MLAAVAFMSIVQSTFTPIQIVSGSVRVQVLSPTLVRIEEKGPKGFEDRQTFTVVDRPSNLQTHEAGDISLGDYTLVVPPNAKATDVAIRDKAGNEVYRYDGKRTPHTYLPGPGEKFSKYVVADNPRIVPPAWGASVAPKNNSQFKESSGWDLSNDAPDLYVFLNGEGGYKTLRAEFLKLTGHTPMLPLKAFGLWDSRYYVYTEKSALDVIDEYRKRGFPLDMFVVDTDWRVNGSHGYHIEEKDFPDMGRFLAEAHARHVGVMYNDHPEPVAPTATAPEELEFRYEGLSSLLKLGADSWWYDRNWMTHLHEPALGLAKEAWGARMFYDMTTAFAPEKRPLVMSNVDGIDNGKRNHAPHPAFHRYPMWWTGDTGAYFSYLQAGIANGVDSGVVSMLPYVNEDLGGHWAHPTSELYVRYLQFGVLSPITRIHCTKGEDRHPWIFGEEAENIVRDYVKLRYRLLPTIYSASRRSYEDGTPLLRRCDLEWPDYKEAASSQQFMLGDDILAAPMNESVMPPAEVVPASMLHTPDGQAGLKGEYFPNKDLSGKPQITRTDSTVDFDWKGEELFSGFPKENFSVRWTGTLGPVPESGEYHLSVRMDDGVRLFLDGKQILNDWGPHSEVAEMAKVKLQKGRTYSLRLEYLQLGADDSCHFEWIRPNAIRPIATRSMWVPPGQWEDVWTGNIVTGPKTMDVKSPLWHTPMYVRRSGIVLLAPEMNYIGEKPWDHLTAEVFSGGSEVSRTLYEDDGASVSYKDGQFRKTVVSMNPSGNGMHLEITPTGSYTGMVAQRAWTVRVHLAKGQKVSGVTVDGHPAKYTTVVSAGDHVKMPFLGSGHGDGKGSGGVVEFQVPSADASRTRSVEVRM